AASAVDVILSAGTTQAFTDDAVPREDIETILRAGLAAQTMYLSAVSLGYGAKIVSSPTMTLNGTDHDAICEKLDVEPSYTAAAVLLVGKPDESVDGVTGASVRAGLEEKTTIG
ncbi:MAG: nitroreductase family protein, partial [Synergistaceae bacterium]|nr:nitroreductase family protein [Synergistaceae bacterium]